MDMMAMVTSLLAAKSGGVQMQVAATIMKSNADAEKFAAQTLLGAGASSLANVVCFTRAPLRQSTLRWPTGSVSAQSTPEHLVKAYLRALPVSGTIACVQYEWDNGKAAENLRKHGVDFADAIAALEDPNRLEEIDTRFEYSEERIQVIGMVRGDVLFVIVTLRGEDSCRIISARKATRHEQDRYYAGHRETW